MTVFALALAAAALALGVWSYGLYPLLIRRLAARAAARAAPLPDEARARGSIEVIVSAADEEAVIAERVRDLLAQDVPGRYTVAIGCDGSRDGTAESARQSLGAGGRVVEFAARRGKASVLNDLVATSEADILVFTDANTFFEPGAVSALARALAEPATGAACGRLVFDPAGGGAGTPESAFWDRETLLKEAEGRLGICLGANGAIYAARRSEVEPLAPDTTSMDDFLIPARIARRGRRVVFAGDAVARERAARDVLAEMPRRFRIGVGAGQVLRRETWLFAAWQRPLLTLAFVSRKAARWLAPVLGLFAVLAGVASPTLAPWSLAALAVLAVCAAAARSRPRLTGLPGRLYYFAVMNLALSAGVLAGLIGYSRAAWKPTGR
jgi:cellulose synthase/poly-beta-1,6-N-acetylglucosamine synthase-like glycosyltransferase